MNLLRRPLTKRERVIAVAACAVVILGTAYSSLVGPLAERWLTVHRRAQEAVARLDELTWLLSQRDAIERDYRALQGALPAGRSDEENKVELLREAEKLARECGLTVSAVRPLASRRDGALVRYGVQLNVRGECTNLVNLIEAMQQPEHLLHTERVTLVAGRTKPTLTLSFVITKLALAEGS